MPPVVFVSAAATFTTMRCPTGVTCGARKRRLWYIGKNIIRKNARIYLCKLQRHLHRHCRTADQTATAPAQSCAGSAAESDRGAQHGRSRRHHLHRLLSRVFCLYNKAVRQGEKCEEERSAAPGKKIIITKVNRGFRHGHFPITN